MAFLNKTAALAYCPIWATHQTSPSENKMKLCLPRIEISLSKIQENARLLCDFYGQKGISLMGVSKAVLGEPAIARAMIAGGVRFIADSRIENIQRMRRAGISAQLVLLRTAPSQAEAIVISADISLNHACHAV